MFTQSQIFSKLQKIPMEFRTANYAVTLAHLSAEHFGGAFAATNNGIFFISGDWKNLVRIPASAANLHKIDFVYDLSARIELEKNLVQNEFKKFSLNNPKIDWSHFYLLMELSQELAFALLHEFVQKFADQICATVTVNKNLSNYMILLRFYNEAESEHLFEVFVPKSFDDFSIKNLFPPFDDEAPVNYTEDVDDILFELLIESLTDKMRN